MKKHTLFAWLLLAPFVVFSGSQSSAYEMPRTHVIPINDAANDRQYELYIKLPKDYEKHQKVRYPVIYFTDAVWHIEALSAATEYLLEDSILVGISWQKDIDDALIKTAGDHVSRYRDYSPRPSDNPEHQSKYHFGQAKQHLDFIRNTVISYTEKHYRTETTQRSYFGYSMGGEFGAYVLLTQPDTFSHYILGSPSLGQADAEYLSSLAKTNATELNNSDAQVLISYGTLEQESGAHIEGLISSLKVLQAQNMSISHPIIEGNHQSAFPLTVVQAVSWLSNNLNSGEKP